MHVTQPAGDPSTTTFTSWGHPAVRATHAGSVEITTEPAITGRATCVVGVSARVEPADLRGYRDEVSITLRAGVHEAVIHAVAHPGFRLDRRIVVRRSRHRSADTFAVGADLDARGLPRPLAAELAHPDTRLVVTIRGRRSAARGGVLTAIAAPAGETLPQPLADRLAAADLVVSGPGALERGRWEWVSSRGPAAEQRAAAALRAGRSVGLVEPEGMVTGHLARRLAAVAVAADADVEPVNLSAEAAALLLAGFDPDLPVWLGRVEGPRAVEAGVLDAPLRGAVCVCSLAAGALAEVLAAVEARHGDLPACVVLDSARPVDTALRGTVAGLRLDVAVGGRALQPALAVIAPGTDADAATQPETELLLASLARQGVPVRVLADAASAALGWGRRHAYRVLSELKDSGG